MSPSSIGLGPKTKHTPFVSGHIEKLEKYMRAAGCDSSIVFKFKDHVHSGKSPGFAVGLAIKELRPDLYKQIRDQQGMQSNWTFKKLLKEFARKRT